MPERIQEWDRGPLPKNAGTRNIPNAAVPSGQFSPSEERGAYAQAATRFDLHSQDNQKTIVRVLTRTAGTGDAIMLTQAEQRDVVLRAARSFLEQNEPGQLDDFDLSFDAVYKTLEDLEPHEEPTADGMGITGQQLLDYPTVAICTLLAHSLVKFCVRYHVLPNLDRWQAELSSLTKRPELVAALRKHLQRFLREIVGESRNAGQK